MGTRLLYSLPGLLLALLALILAIVGLSHNTESQKQPTSAQHETRNTNDYRYWVVTAPMKAGDKLAEDKLARVSSPTAIPGVIATDRQVAGQVLYRALRPGELIGENAFQKDKKSLPSVLPAGRRAFAIPVNDVSGAGGLLRPGDTVDVVTAFGHSNDRKGAAAMVTLHSIPVLAVHGLLSEGDGKKEQGRSRNNTVVLSVPEDKVTALMLASTKGDIRLAVVSNDEASSGTESAERDEAADAGGMVSQATETEKSTNKPFYYNDFFPAEHKTPVRAAPRRPAGHRVQVFEGAKTRSTYVR